jgi:hypothetical protein
MSHVQGCIVGQPVSLSWSRLLDFQGYMGLWVQVITRCDNCGGRVQLGAYCEGCGTKSDGDKPPGMSQLRHAAQRCLTAMRKLSNAQPAGKYQRLREDIQIECWHRSKEKGREDVYTKDQHKDYEVDKAGAVEMKERFRRLDDDTVEFTPYYATIIPSFLSDIELEICSGICIRPEQVEEIRARRDEEATNEAIADMRANSSVQFGPNGKSEILFFDDDNRVTGRLVFQDGHWSLSGKVDESASKFLAAINPKPELTPVITE